mmetsp:Transcript_26729/g.64779  ORF Transcript_26729/g.64779 Transcript_26729/m.64779 type:complete len:206 (+) Transcript_26729:660-1277(+)
MSADARDAVIMMQSLQFPFMVSLRSSVSLLSRKGTCDWRSAIDFITFPNVVRDTLIALPSFCVLPFAPVRTIRSEPARSTSVILAVVLCMSASTWVIDICSMLWDLELSEFMFVLETMRFAFPSSMRFRIDSSSLTSTVTAPSMHTPPTVRIDSGVEECGFRRSVNFSLYTCTKLTLKRRREPSGRFASNLPHTASRIRGMSPLD